MRMLLDIFAQIFRTLWAHKLRSFLTMFGIAWGVGSLLLLVGLGEGFRSGNQREMAQYGKDIMFIFPGRAPVVQGSMNSARNYLLTYQDYADIRKEAPHVRNASPVLSSTGRTRGQRIRQREWRNCRSGAAVQRHSLSSTQTGALAQQPG